MIRIQALGNIGKDAEITRIEGSAYVAIKFSVGVTEKYTDKNNQPVSKTSWIRCTYWRKSDKTQIAAYLKKGVKVYVEGIPSAQAYLNNEGKPTASLEMRVQGITLAGSAISHVHTGSGTGHAGTNNTNNTNNTNYFPQNLPEDEFLQIPQDSNFDDLPF